MVSRSTAGSPDLSSEVILWVICPALGVWKWQENILEVLEWNIKHKVVTMMRWGNVLGQLVLRWSTKCPGFEYWQGCIFLSGFKKHPRNASWEPTCICHLFLALCQKQAARKVQCNSVFDWKSGTYVLWRCKIQLRNHPEKVQCVLWMSHCPFLESHVSSSAVGSGSSLVWSQIWGFWGWEGYSWVAGIQSSSRFCFLKEISLCLLNKHFADESNL